jgi:iron complex outermembrane recepter protein
MRFRHTLLASAVSMACSISLTLTAAPAKAQTMLEEVIVTAQKRSESVQDIPLAVTALSSDMLDERGITDIASMAASVPGMNFSQSGNNTRITVRGIGTENTTVTGDPGVALHIDGVYQARSSVGNVLFYDLARVEVLRGPQGTLYGRNATGGSINLISNPPVDEFEAQIEGQIGNYSQQRVRGVLNTPVMDEKLLLRFSGQYENRDGYYEDLTPGADDLTDVDAVNVRAQALYLLSANIDATLNYNYSTDKGAGPGVKALSYPPPPGLVANLLATATPNPSDPWKIRTNGIDDRNNSRKGTYLTINWDLGEVALKSISAWQDNDVDTFSDSDLSDADIFNATSQQNSTQYSQEIHLTSTGGGDWEWVTGLFWMTEETNAEFWYTDMGAGLSTYPFFPTIDVGLAEPSYFGNDSTTTTDTFGAFGQASYHIYDDLSVTAGLRYSYDKKKSDIFRKEFTAPAATSFKKDDDWNKTTWKLGVDWNVTEESMLYASVSTGFKSGGFLQIEAAEPYDEETVTAYEIGSKNRFFDNRLQANISAYYYDYTDMQLRTIRDLNSIVSNAGESEIKGIEVELTGQPTDALQLTAAFAFTNAEFTDYSADDPQVPGLEPEDLSGNSLPRSPDSTVNLTAAYSWDFDFGSLTASADYYWSDKVYFGPFNVSEESQGSYHRTGARLSFNSADDTWYLAAAVSNIEDDEVASQLMLGDATLRTATNAQWQSPRTYTLTAGYRFH